MVRTLKPGRSDAGMHCVWQAYDPIHSDHSTDKDTSGMHAMLFFICLNLLWAQRKRRPRHTALFITYISLHFICGTLIIAGGMLFTEMTWIDNRGYPGGPLAFLQEQQPFWSNFMANVLSVMTAWLQDILLVRESLLSTPQCSAR